MARVSGPKCTHNFLLQSRKCLSCHLCLIIYTQVFLCSVNDHVEKWIDLHCSKGYWNPKQKLGVTMHFLGDTCNQVAIILEVLKYRTMFRFSFTLILL